MTGIASIFQKQKMTLELRSQAHRPTDTDRPFTITCVKQNPKLSVAEFYYSSKVTLHKCRYIKVFFLTYKSNTIYNDKKI